ncbi:hypothetical protein, partial [Desulfofundulus luciae]|uniref:hypothetical protein n=1 Tax=Desulfofundulus luciae TaxID=74702 RepID=UPI0027D8BD51
MGITTIFEVLLANCYQYPFHDTVIAQFTGTGTVPAVESGIDFVGLGTRNMGTGSQPSGQPILFLNWNLGLSGGSNTMIR